MKYYGSDRRPSKNSLQHWKYIKREKVGDKWKYYYDYDQLKSDAGRAASNVADKVSSTARNVASNVQKQVNKATGVTAKQNYQQTKTNYEDRLSKEAALDAERRKKAEASYVSARDKRDNAGLVSKAMFGKEMNANVKKASDRINAEDKNAQERRARTIAERDKAVGDAEKAYRKTLVGKTDAAKDWAEDRVDDVKDVARSAGKKVSKAVAKGIDYLADDVTTVRDRRTGKVISRTVEKGAVSKAVDKVKDAADDAKDWAEDRVDDVKGAAKKAGKAVGNAARKAGDAITDTADDVKEWGTKTVSNVRETASKTVDSGKEFIKGLFSGKKKSKKKKTYTSHNLERNKNMRADRRGGSSRRTNAQR